MDKKVIIADDFENVRKSYCKMINNYFPDTKIDEVEDGDLLVEKVKNNCDYDLIITDQNMPKMSGLKAIEEIRKFDKKTPIYMISFEPAYENFAIAKGANGFIDKTNSYTELPKLIEKYLKE
ncbi:response regulator transcription factor [Candidatus Woesearchaeota archaeon]|nr:response regulator transcription factor [Candidatus Woesearchaeota archaeon]